MTGGALSGEKVLDQRTSGAFGGLRIDGNLQITYVRVDSPSVYDVW
jgi:hypothetical protein